MIALLGVMLGGAFTPERLAGASAWLPSLAALPFYVVTVGVLILLYLRRMSDFDRASAFFAATPGGMSEMIALSDQLGGDQRRVSLVHGTRLLFIVFSIPFLARAFGSDPAAAPRSLAVVEIDPAALALLAVAGVLGYLFARRVRLPAATFVGPLLGSTVVHLAGWIATEPPYLLLALAQLVIGSSVGARFSGTPLGLVLRALALGAGATLLMLAVTLRLRRRPARADRAAARAAAAGLHPRRLRRDEPDRARHGGRSRLRGDPPQPAGVPGRADRAAAVRLAAAAGLDGRAVEPADSRRAAGSRSAVDSRAPCGHHRSPNPRDQTPERSSLRRPEPS